MREFKAENGADGYTITVYGGGTSMVIAKGDAPSVLLQGDEAANAYAEYCDLLTDHMKPGTRASRFTWRELLGQMFDCYFD